MDFGIGFVLFLTAMIACIATGNSMIPALLAGLVIFTVLGVRRGYSLRQLAKWGSESVKESTVVIKVMLIIGLITAGVIISGVYFGDR